MVNAHRMTDKPELRPGDYCWYWISGHRGAGVVERVTQYSVYVLTGTTAKGGRIIQRFDRIKVDKRERER